MHVHPKKLGKIYPEQSFKCFPELPYQSRRPDISFISADRTKLVAAEGHIAIVPDIAVEVVSPKDKLYEVDEKLDDYRSAGVKFV